MTVYFIRSDCGRVKVGFTVESTPEQRLFSLQSASPRKLECIFYFPGGIDVERTIHRYLVEDRVHREWFEPSQRLANVLAYAREFRSIEGLGQALEKPETWADFRARYGTSSRIGVKAPLPSPDTRWRQELARAAREIKPEPPPVRPTFDWFSTWSQASIRGRPDRDFIEHCAQEYTGSESRCEWFDGAWDFSSGLDETATMLAKHADDPERAGAVWILACIQDLTNSRHNVFPPTLWDRVPEAEALSDQLEALVKARWHRSATNALPFRMALPKRCALTVDEFVEACAHHRRLIVAECRLRFSWALGSSMSLRCHAEAAA